MIKKILAGVFLTTVTGFSLYILTGEFLPRDFKIVREITIDAPPEEVAPYINTLKKRKAWSPFQTPETENKFEGPASGKGAKMIFDGGTIEITKSNSPQEVVYDTHFDDGYPTSTSQFLFKEMGDGKTHVVWNFTGKVPKNPFRRYDIFTIEEETGAKHLKGLEKLKEVAESS